MEKEQIVALKNAVHESMVRTAITLNKKRIRANGSELSLDKILNWPEYSKQRHQQQQQQQQHRMSLPPISPMWIFKHLRYSYLV